MLLLDLRAHKCDYKNDSEPELCCICNIYSNVMLFDHLMTASIYEYDWLVTAIVMVGWVQLYNVLWWYYTSAQ